MEKSCNSINLESGYFLFYDGSCAMCHFALNLLMANAKKKLNVVSTGSNFFKENLDYLRIKNIDSLIFLKNGIVYTHSSACLEALDICKFPLKFLKIFKFIPKSLRDNLYELIAKKRFFISKFFNLQCTFDPSISSHNSFIEFRTLLKIISDN